MDEPEEILKAAQTEIIDMLGKGKTDADNCRRKIVQAVRTITRRETARRPVVIPVVLEF
jgi:mRNA degradation ribonuclease J1/J2